MRRKLLFATSLLLIVSLAGLALYVKYGDHRPLIERLVTEGLGRPLVIQGALESDLGLAARFTAEDVVLAGPPWSEAPAFVHVDRLHGSVSLWSFIRGPMRIADLHVEGARVFLEVDPLGRASWHFPLLEDDEDADPQAED